MLGLWTQMCRQVIPPFAQEFQGFVRVSFVLKNSEGHHHRRTLSLPTILVPDFFVTAVIAKQLPIEQHGLSLIGPILLLLSSIAIAMPITVGR